MRERCRKRKANNEEQIATATDMGSFGLLWAPFSGAIDPIWNWEDPKTQLDHISADNILYFIPDSEKSSR